MDSGVHRPSMMIGMPQNFIFGKSGPVLSQSEDGKNKDIIRFYEKRIWPPVNNEWKNFGFFSFDKKDQKRRKSQLYSMDNPIYFYYFYIYLF